MTKTTVWSIVGMGAVLLASLEARAQVNDNCANTTQCVTASNTSSGGALTASCNGSPSGSPNACLQIQENSTNPQNIADGARIGAIAGVGVRATSIFNNAVLAQNFITDMSAAVISAVTANTTALSYWGGGGIQLVGGFAQKAGGGSWSAPSDQRIKKDVADFRLGLAELKKVRPVSFKYNGLGGTVDDGKPYVGVIAQELEKVLPGMVTSSKEKLRKSDASTVDLKQVDPSAFTYVLINAVQEQQKIIERQESRIAALEHARSPLASSLFSGVGGAGLAAGFLPLGMLAVLRRRKKRASS